LPGNSGKQAPATLTEVALPTEVEQVVQPLLTEVERRRVRGREPSPSERADAGAKESLTVSCAPLVTVGRGAEVGNAPPTLH